MVAELVEREIMLSPRQCVHIEKYLYGLLKWYVISRSVKLNSDLHRDDICACRDQTCNEFGSYSVNYWCEDI